MLGQHLSQGEYRDFLVLLAEQHYTKAAKTGAVTAAFGLLRVKLNMTSGYANARKRRTGESQKLANAAARTS